MQDTYMGIEDIEIPEVPIPARILAEKRAEIRRAKRAAERKQNSKSRRGISRSSVKKAS
ncbi:MAG: hypothetical protein F2571_03870 [Actinobacteria bacterium]|uniref:Unannotated protein n=1 Tax=freshwater metagenome TaxID=449393 RepID=A0A6J6B2I3_9ZZZZ|nr:hypothetical protein [Actinomycetota bacterium]MTA35923.1 hypothetical protein [Actinomycetota bacterium]MTA36086.1 hypothetical protein [Actinomycetota bacterium]